MQIKQFKNGNFNIKKELWYDGEQGGIERLLELLCNSIEADFMPSGEDDGLVPLCGGNNYAYYELYNSNTDKFYRVDMNDCIKFDREETVKLVGYEL